MTHEHKPSGVIRWEFIADDSKQFTRCECGATLSRQTAPTGARYNWEDWKAN